MNKPLDQNEANPLCVYIKGQQMYKNIVNESFPLDLNVDYNGVENTIVL